MTDSTIVKLLSQLSKAEIQTLRKVVRSPYFNGKEELVKLFDYLADNLLKPANRLEKSVVEKHVFGRKQMDDSSSLNRMASNLTDIVRDYLAFEEMKADGSQSKVYLQLAFKRRGMVEHRERELPRALSENEKQPLRDLQYHYRQCVLNWEYFDLSAGVKWETTAEFAAMEEQQSYYVLTKIIKLGCLGASLESRSGQKKDILFLEEAIRYVEEHQLWNVPAIRVFYHTYKCLKNENADEHVEILRSLLTQKKSGFSDFDLQHVTNAVTTYFNRQYSITGDQKWLRESFKLFTTALENGVFVPNDVISKYNFHNFVSLGLSLKEFVWVMSFIETYKKYLPPQDRENTANFHLALYHFHTGAYDKSMKLLQKVILHDEVMFNIEARGILVAIYYENGSHEALRYHLDAYKTYLKRHPETGVFKEMHLHFISFVQKMLKIKPTDTAAKEKLREEVRMTPHVREREWLVQQLAA